ncbi:MAG: SLBB domain-containing protein [Alphaproteobacteria bacterium]
MPIPPPLERQTLESVLRERILEHAAADPTFLSQPGVLALVMEQLEELRSPLERDYSKRLGEDVRQFGYEVFRPRPIEPGPLSGAVQETYRLGIGDELVVTFRGQVSKSLAVRVDREGRIILPDLLPIPAAGRTFGDFVQELKARTGTAFIGTEVFVSLGRLRAISVMVLGEVETPGVKQLTGLSTLVDALAVSGGIKKTGSLRRIRVVRDADMYWFDAYDLLFTGDFDRPLTLMEGDRIVVEPIGATVAIAGEVKRPGIYELAEGQDSISLAEFLSYAGGTLRPSGNRYLTITADETGRERVLEQRDVAPVSLSDGNIVLVRFAEDVQIGSVFLDGHVRVPGRRSLATAPTIAHLVRDIEVLKEGPYLLFAVLQTRDPLSQSSVFVPIDLQRVLARQENYKLSAEDRLIVLGMDDVRYLGSADVQRLLAGADLEEPAEPPGEEAAGERLPELPVGVEAAAVPELRVPRLPVVQEEVEEERPPCPGLVSLFSVVASSTPGRFSTALRTSAKDLEAVETTSVPCPEVYERFPDLLPFVLEHVVAVDGEVRTPGAYPAVPDTPLASLIAYAGGTTREANLTKVEFSRTQVDPETGTATVERQVIDVAAPAVANPRPADVLVGPGDAVRVSPVFTDREERPVLLLGEFVRPGLYTIRRGERLSDVIVRAGGLTPQAYPLGAVFTRERIKEVEKAAFRRSARELEIALAAALMQPRTAPQVAAGAGAITALAETLRETEPIGRVVIEADPAALEARPELDTVLEGGDSIFMPKLPNSVTVIGEVLNPGSVQFVAGGRVDDYVKTAGGFRRSADEGRTFVVLPNGAAEPVSFSAWNLSPVQIAPGSTVVVPPEVAPLDLFALVRDTTALISQIALTAASVAAIRD